jgi:uncharacterized SAM-binding protein YcdF (DUF218 family)
MFFVLSKVLGFLTLPSNLMLFAGLIGAVLLFTRFASTGRRIVAVSFILVLLFGMLPLGDVLVYPLENRFPSWDPAHGTPDGIVVLGGAIDPDLSAVHGETSINDAAERITVVADLAKRYPRARIVYSGGSGNLFSPDKSEADYVFGLFKSFGIPRDHVLLERKSRNTWENAVFSKELVQPKPKERWLLVTSGFHMPRAIGAFRKAGFPVEAYPVDWRTADLPHVLTSVNAFASGLGATDLAMHEWAGLLAYWVTGRCSSLFPGP